VAVVEISTLFNNVYSSAQHLSAPLYTAIRHHHVMSRGADLEFQKEGLGLLATGKPPELTAQITSFFVENMILTTFSQE